MATHFDYDIVILEAHPSSDYRYIARVGTILRNSAEDSKTVSWHEHRIPEMWGMSQDEAYEKLENLIHEWIATQQ
jgi:hypothetical protein